MYILMGYYHKNIYLYVYVYWALCPPHRGGSIVVTETRKTKTLVPSIFYIRTYTIYNTYLNMYMANLCSKVII